MTTAALSMLRREPVVVPESAERMAQDIMADVNRKFGYSRLKAVSEQAEMGRELRAVLAELEIQPFARDSVDRYKRAMTFIGWPYLATVCLGLPALLGACLWTIISFASSPGFTAAAVTGAGMVIGLIAGIAFCFLLSADGRPSKFWRSEWLSDTAVEIPLFALQTALAIHARVPHARFHIERLASRQEAREEEARRRAEDPFLVVRYGDYEAYVEVWDEPGFESRRKA